MAFNVVETTYSRNTNFSFDKQSATLQFIGWNDLDDAVARAGFVAAVPLIWNGLLYEDMSVTAVGGGVWEASVKYNSLVTETATGSGGASPPPPPPPAPAATDALGPEYSWDISAVTEHIVSSLNTIQKVALSGEGTSPDQSNAIGVTGKGEIQGCDRVTPKLEFSITKNKEFVTLGYLKTLNELTGTVNNATFYQFSAGEVLFMGASGSPKTADGKVPISYKFAVAFNQPTLTVAPGLTFSSTKKGWNYIWIAYRNDTSSSRSVQKPYAAYLEQIYEEKSFALLDVGT